MPSASVASRCDDGAVHGASHELDVAVRACLLGLVAILVAAGSSAIQTRAVLTLAIAAVMVAVGLRRDWRQPWALPLFVVALVTLAIPTLISFGIPIGLVTQDDLQSKTLGIGVSATLGFLAGASLTARLWPGRVPRQTSLGGSRLSGTLIGGAIACSVAQLPARLGTTYGLGQTSFGLVSVLSNASLALALTAVLSRDGIGRRRPGSSRFLAAFILWVALTLAVGSRAPVVVAGLLVAQRTLKPAIGRRQIPAVVTVVVLSLLLLPSVAMLRVGGAVSLSSAATFDAVLGDLSSPTYIDNLLVRDHPEALGTDHGRTYLAAVVRQLPRVISEPLLGPPTDTGAYRFRELVSMNDPNAGLGFGFTSEALLNFGQTGVFVAAALLAVFLGLLYRRSSAAASATYLVAVAGLPYALRSDALAHLKLIWVPVALLLIVRAASGRDETARGHSATQDELP